MKEDTGVLTSSGVSTVPPGSWWVLYERCGPLPDLSCLVWPCLSSHHTTVRTADSVHFLSFFRWLSITLMLSTIPLTCLSFHSGEQLYSYSSCSAYASCWLVSCTCMSRGSRYDYSIFWSCSLSVWYFNIQVLLFALCRISANPLETIIDDCVVVCSAVFPQCLAHLSFCPLVFSWLPNHSDPHRSLHSHSALNLRCGPGLCGKWREI